MQQSCTKFKQLPLSLLPKARRSIRLNHTIAHIGDYIITCYHYIAGMVVFHWYYYTKLIEEYLYCVYKCIFYSCQLMSACTPLKLSSLHVNILLFYFPDQSYLKKLVVETSCKIQVMIDIIPFCSQHHVHVFLH